jgi:hypothetical protein
MKQIVGAQGEITIIRIDTLPAMQHKPVERNAHGAIISHSESVMERTDAVPDGMRIIYACLSADCLLEQDAPVPHEHFELPAGIYEFRISREYNPFLEQARLVQD